MTGLVALFGLLVVLTPWQSVFAACGSPIRYQEQLEVIDHRLKAHNQIIKRRPDSWTHLDTIAGLHLERAALTGEFESYLDAIESLDGAFEMSEAGAGPYLTRAMLNFSIHRLDAVEADLVLAESALLIDQSVRNTIEGIRADVRLYTGHYSQAKMAYERLDATNPTVTSATDFAHYYLQIARYNEAELWLEKAEQRVTGQCAYLRAWLALQNGILDLERGRLDDALAHYQAGLGLFPGFWLLEEHVAEIDAMQGRDRKAEVAYRDLINRTGSPLFMLALADILAARASNESLSEAVRWQDKAQSIYEQRIALLPEVASGHALDYFLRSDDSARALTLAHANYQQRPGGLAALQLIQAHIRLGQLAEASALLDALLASAYRSAELHATAGVLYQAEGESRLADKHNSLAQSINRYAVADIAWLRQTRNTSSHELKAY